MYYAKARFYDAENRRFAAVDPILDPSQFDLVELVADAKLFTQYTYVADNPLTNIDPTGMVITPANVVGAVIGALGGAVVGTAIANYFDLHGCARALAIAGGTGLMTVVGWFAGPAVYKALKPLVLKAIVAGQLVIDKATQWIIDALGINTWGNLSRAKEFGLKTYKALRALINKTGLQAHHIIEQRFKLGIQVQLDSIVATFSMFEDNPHFSQIQSLMESRHIYPISEATFSTSELENSEWLSVRSTWRTGYPLPVEENQYVYSTYDTIDYCEDCGFGLKQTNSFIVKKAPNWSTRNFMMLNWIHDELFMSEKAELLLYNSGLTGYTVKDVVDKAGTKIPNIRQLYINHILRQGLCMESVEKVYHCPKCGRNRYLLKVGRIRYRKEVFKDLRSDIVKSFEQFGEITCNRMILISQSFYKFLVRTKIDRGLLFEPIELVDL